jgi:phosphoglucomutase
MDEWLHDIQEKLRPEAWERISALVDGQPEEWELASVRELIEKKHWTELDDRFYKSLGFGTGGMRGRTIGRVITAAERGAANPRGRPEHAAVGSNMMNFRNAGRAAAALGAYCQRIFPRERVRVAIAHDTRHYSPELARAAARTLAALGIEVFLFNGPRSTPQLSFTVRWLRAQAGIVITASHNPPHDNGFKAYFADGGQIIEKHARGIIEAAPDPSDGLQEAPTQIPEIQTLGRDADEAYLDAVRSVRLESEAVAQAAAELKIVFTPIHGTGIVAIPELLRGLGCQVSLVEEQTVPDGSFPTVESPNPENAEALRMAIKQAVRQNADLVIGTDPDADRMGLAVRDRTGNFQILSGNQIGSILAYYRCERLFAHGILTAANRHRAAIIKTIVTSDLQQRIAEHFGVKCVNTLTGFKYIGEKLHDYECEGGLADAPGLTAEARRGAQLAHGTFFIFGGEESYGYSGGDYVRDKDANAAALMIAEAAAWARRDGRTLLEYLDTIYRQLGYFHERLGTLTFEGAEGAAQIRRLLESYKDDRPKAYLGIPVAKVDDYAAGPMRDLDGKLLPKENVLVFHLEDASRMAVRASGTEPKIKYYFFVQAPPGGELEAARQERMNFADRWWEAVRDEVAGRAGR